MSPYSFRYPGQRWSIHFGSMQGVERFALEELYGTVQSYLPYTVAIHPAGESEPEEHALLAGTPRDNPLIERLVQDGTLRLPESPEGFTLASRPAPWNAACRMVAVAGNTPAAVLYGVETLIARSLPEKKGGDPRQALDSLPDFEIQDYPRIARRGVWSWGYVVYDYRRFLDNMARLRLNALTLWNDVPPLNCAEVIDYAHARGVRVYLGFPWGWGMEYNLAEPADRQAIAAQVLQHYQDEIAPLYPDGIYFQTLTEHHQTSLGGRSVAAITCELVNETAAKLYEITPELEIQFGLHATSIQDHFTELSALDPRVTIVWEDAGALPYSYLPRLKDFGRTFQETLDYSRALARFRPGTTFGMVAKGWTNLDWANEFEHHGPYLLGVSSRETIRRRYARVRRRWALVNRLWRLYEKQGRAFYQALAEETGGNMLVQGLIEDGLLEEKIQPGVEMFAEMLWNPEEKR